jgi:hypothetical protein
MPRPHRRITCRPPEKLSLYRRRPAVACMVKRSIRLSGGTVRKPRLHLVAGGRP